MEFICVFIYFYMVALALSEIALLNNLIFDFKNIFLTLFLEIKSAKFLEVFYYYFSLNSLSLKFSKLPIFYLFLNLSIFMILLNFLIFILWFDFFI